ncbi:hypothetical protein BC939DRAFT_443050 [Gamsiella multidivaricata]|uniref:uncharacterized protein n=1 Tax=Gamsiella multidivaricata TaxID=101098 RepID=UPI00221E80A8|nr:uncharacterized protein BC939DRAFT_443050 [Gamsiella multidivaricata]KAI7828823.1 hypothetical protein BC939DRAFT_443050 [Gamsiella multidivaricata]
MNSLRANQPPFTRSQSAIPSTMQQLSLPLLLPTPLAQAARATTSALQPARLSPTPDPRIEADTSIKAKRAKTFWNTLGMETFLDWITDPYNHERLNKKHPVAGQRAIDLYDEISKAVYDKHRVTWDNNHVKYRIINARKKYDAARALSEVTGGGETRDVDALRKEMLVLCPPFDRLDAVWGGTLARDPPPPRETCNRRDEEYYNIETSPEVIETDEDEDNQTTAVQDDSDVRATPAKRGAAHARTAGKRRKGNDGLPDSFQATLDAIRGAFINARNTNTNAGDNASNVTLGWAELIRKQEEMLAKSREDLEEEKRSIKMEKEIERNELKRLREEFKQEVAEFKREVAAFTKERSDYLARREKDGSRVVVETMKS